MIVIGSFSAAVSGCDRKHSTLMNHEFHLLSSGSKIRRPSNFLLSFAARGAIVLLAALTMEPSARAENASAPHAVSAEPAGTLPAADYRLAPRDLVKVELFNQPDMETIQRLTANGEVRLPFIGIVCIARLTVREAEMELERRFVDGGFFVAPQVTIAVQQFGERYVSIIGQVKNPGRIALAPEAASIGIFDAVAQAGGFTRIARTDAIQVTRRSADRSDEKLVVNLDLYLEAKGRATSREFQLLPGDVLVVPERVF